MTRIRLRTLTALLGAALVAAACGGIALNDSDLLPALVVVVDESGHPLPGAIVSVQAGDVVTDRRGEARVGAAGPVAGTVTAPGRLTEPVVVVPGRRQVVRLWSRRGTDGTVRRSLHFGGDVMLGRRYLDPTREGTARVAEGDGGVSARAVVAALGPVMAAADVSGVNLETVLGDPPASAVLPGKRFTLRSPAETVAMLQALGVDVVALGNNHSYDWGEPGLATTRDLLTSAGIAFTGAGEDLETGRQPAVLDVPGGSVTILSYSTVNGDFVNDHLATSTDPVPVPLAPEEAWQYRPRRFGYGRGGQVAFLPSGEWLPGDVWRWFSEIEGRLDEGESAEVWAALTAPDAFPELQDWVARRGHGGAVPFRSDVVAADIAAAEGFVVVELHSGYQFAPTASRFMRSAARAAIDAGADLVVAHHPHVLQGIEWYRGRLIAHSLGNLVFDQDFLSTFPTAVLRVVLAGERVLEARLIPLVLDGYRPRPVTGRAATRVFSIVNAATLAPGWAVRLPDETVGIVPGEVGVPAVVGPDGRIGVGTEAMAVTQAPDGEGVVDLPPGSIVDAAAGVEVGRDLLGWGWFDDTEADGEDAAAALWSVETARDVEIAREGGNSVLRLYANRRGTARIRPVARVTLAEHRRYTPEGEPLDSAARYTLRLRARAPIDLELTVRVDAYTVDASDPLRRPTSELVRTTLLRVPVTAGAEFRPYDIEIPVAAVTASDGPVDAVMFYLGATAPRAAAVTVDDVRFLEWRAASGGPVVADALWFPDGGVAVGADGAP